MKVYIITTHFTNNMGALLQCYALSKYLITRESVDCKVLNYLPKDDDLSWKIWPKPECFKDILKNFYSLMPHKIFTKLRKNRVMRSFISDYLPISDIIYRRKDLLQNPPVADAYICGSDQIWNFRLFDDLTYYLDFCDKIQTRRISYAASITDYWNQKQQELVRPWLQKFDTITLRDRNYVSAVSEIAKKEVSFVCDPVFLLSGEEWATFAKEDKCLNEPYILCYFISVPDVAVKAVEKLRKKTGYKVVHLNVNSRDRFNSDFDIKVANPRDFVGLIKNATYLCTNSFHCSSFSIIFQKDFMFLKGKIDERAETLKEIFKIPNIIINKETVDQLGMIDYHVDYVEGKESGELFVKQSKRILHDSIWNR